MLSVAESARALRAGTVTSAELVARVCRAAEAAAELNAWVELWGEEALEVARAHDCLLSAGYDLGPLHGIPVGLKANIEVAAHRMSAGSAILVDHVATRDAEVVTRLRRAGAILVGATGMHEFAWGGTSDNPHTGAISNPWDLSRIPAGSSGGSGAAVAARTVPVALGTDTGGSIRLPASMNGITGIRPTIGAVPTDGVFPLAWTMDTVGPLAVTAEDCALVHRVLAGSKRAGSGVGEARAPGRIGVLRAYSGHALQPAVHGAMNAMIDGFAELGCAVRDVEIAGLDEAIDAQIVVDAAEPTALHLPWLRERLGDYGDDVRDQLLAGTVFTAVDYVQAQRYRQHVREQLTEALKHVDVLLTPTVPFTAPRRGQRFIDVEDGSEDVLTANMRFTCLPSLSGLPAISLPAGHDGDGMPIGMQLIGPANGEEMLFAAGQAWQANTDFHLRRPPGFGPDEAI